MLFVHIPDPTAQTNLQVMILCTHSNFATGTLNYSPSTQRITCEIHGCPYCLNERREKSLATAYIVCPHGTNSKITRIRGTWVCEELTRCGECAYYINPHEPVYGYDDSGRGNLF